MSSYGLDGVMSWAQAHHIASTCAEPLPAVKARLDEAAGGIIAQPILTLSDYPSADVPAIDGYAVRGEGPWRVTEDDSLNSSRAIPVRAGGRLPENTDAVLPFSMANTRQHNDESVSIIALDGLTQMPDERVRPVHGSGILHRAEVSPGGSVMVPAGRKVNPSILALAAASGHDEIVIIKPPVVGLIVVGASLLSQGISRDGRVRDALGNTIPSFVAAHGGRGNPAVRAPDTAELLMTEIEDAAVDVLITTGSTAPESDNDVRRVLRDLNAHWLIDGVAATPGSQMLLAQLPDGRFIVGLPGDPPSALAALVTLVAPLLTMLSGAPVDRAHPTATLSADTPVAEYADDTRLAPVKLQHVEGRLVAHPIPDSGPANLQGWALADGIAIVPPGAGFRGDVVSYLPQY